MTNETPVFRKFTDERRILPGSKHHGSDGLLPPAVQVGLGAGLILEVDVSILLGEGPSLESDHVTWFAVSWLNLNEILMKSEMNEILTLTDLINGV